MAIRTNYCFIRIVEWFWFEWAVVHVGRVSLAEATSRTARGTMLRFEASTIGR